MEKLNDTAWNDRLVSHVPTLNSIAHDLAHDLAPVYMHDLPPT